MTKHRHYHRNSHKCLTSLWSHSTELYHSGTRIAEFLETFFYKYNKQTQNLITYYTIK